MHEHGRMEFEKIPELKQFSSVFALNHGQLFAEKNSAAASLCVRCALNENDDRPENPTDVVFSAKCQNKVSYSSGDTLCANNMTCSNQRSNRFVWISHLNRMIATDSIHLFFFVAQFESRKSKQKNSMEISSNKNQILKRRLLIGISWGTHLISVVVETSSPEKSMDSFALQHIATQYTMNSYYVGLLFVNKKVGGASSRSLLARTYSFI